MEKISDDIKKHISLIKSSIDSEALRKNLCPFFEKGGCPDCIACDKSDAALEECKEIYLEHIVTTPIAVWNEDFEKSLAYSREKCDPTDIVSIGLACNRCYMSEKCPLYKKDYACGINWGANKPENPMQFMDFLIGLQYERVKRQSIFEKVDGGVPDAGLSSEIDRLSNLIYNKADLSRDRLSINVEATSMPRSGGGGILSKLFGGGGSEEPVKIPEKPASREGVIDIEDAIEIKEPQKVSRRRKK